jgi:hypothetical protein
VAHAPTRYTPSMAGGPLAEHVTCMVCLDDGALTRAVRTYEGVESDQYRCDLGHEFGLDWPEIAADPQWPPPPDIAALVVRSS